MQSIGNRHISQNPDLPDGRHLLYVVSDNGLNINLATQIYAFAIDSTLTESGAPVSSRLSLFSRASQEVVSPIAAETAGGAKWIIRGGHHDRIGHRCHDRRRRDPCRDVAH